MYPKSSQIRLNEACRSLWVRTPDPALPPSAVAPQLARRAVLILRFGLETGDPAIERCARELDLWLTGTCPLELRAPLALNDAERRALADRLELAFDRGALLVEAEQAPAQRARELPLPAAKSDDSSSFFELRLIDEIGQAIAGIQIDFVVDGAAQSLTTNAAGVALLNGATAMRAEIHLRDTKGLDHALDRRWRSRRAGSPARTGSTRHAVYNGEPLGPFSISAAVPNTLMLEPPVCRLRLHDAIGNPLPRVVYRVTSPGFDKDEHTTDDAGWARVWLGRAWPDRVEIEWDKLPSEKFCYRREIHLDCDAGGGDDVPQRRLHNLGYLAASDPASTDLGLDYCSTNPRQTLADIFGRRDCLALRSQGA